MYTILQPFLHYLHCCLWLVGKNCFKVTKKKMVVFTIRCFWLLCEVDLCCWTPAVFNSITSTSPEDGDATFSYDSALFSDSSWLDIKVCKTCGYAFACFQPCKFWCCMLKLITHLTIIKELPDISTSESESEWAMERDVPDGRLGSGVSGMILSDSVE